MVAGSTLKSGGIDLLDRMKEGLDQPQRVVSLAAVVTGHVGTGSRWQLADRRRRHAGEPG